MKLEEVLGAYREGKIIISEKREHYQKCHIDGCHRLASAPETELLGEWTIHETPKTKVKLWPALVQNSGNGWMVTSTLFSSDKDASHSPQLDGYKKVIWPAIPGPSGEYEVEE